MIKTKIIILINWFLDEFGYILFNNKLFCWLWGIDYESGCYKKTGCPAF